MNLRRIAFTIAACLVLSSTSAFAETIGLTIRGTDAIWLAGRTDLVIPPAAAAWPGGLLRHENPTPEELLETLPDGYYLSAGDIISVYDPAEGAISFFNGFGGVVFGPDGNGLPGSSSITSFGGISGYIGTQGALVGVFLSNAVPNGAAPATLDFSTGGLGIDFLSLSPELGQVFFVGDGLTSDGTFQQFTAPAGATRVLFGVTDAFGFNGAPGAYDDNDGDYCIDIGVVQAPEPTSLALLGLGLAALGLAKRKSERGEMPKTKILKS